MKYFVVYLLEKAMAKQSTSFRLPESTQKKLGELTEIFRESGSESVERAIDFLYEHRVDEAKKDLERRISAAKAKE